MGPTDRRFEIVVGIEGTESPLCPWDYVDGWKWTEEKLMALEGVDASIDVAKISRPSDVEIFGRVFVDHDPEDRLRAVFRQDVETTDDPRP